MTPLGQGLLPAITSIVEVGSRLLLSGHAAITAARRHRAGYCAPVVRIRFVFGNGACCIGPLTSSLIASRIQRLAGS
ncbi:hypothetical protein [Burkholderia semiarida]|uniref:hypothetical protein n=1 Tax=Burkholderia semiarida TaxID=2843303 RepID=UPI003877A037|nr:hypothetical protein OH687_37635 [Burkholderia anthina]